MRENRRANSVTLWTQTAFYGAINPPRIGPSSPVNLLWNMRRVDAPCKVDCQHNSASDSSSLQRRAWSFGPSLFLRESLSATVCHWQRRPPATPGSIFGLSDLLDEGSHMSIYHRGLGCLIGNGRLPASAFMIKGDLMTDERHQAVIKRCLFSIFARTGGWILQSLK